MNWAGEMSPWPGQAPSHQRLGADDAPVAKVDLRLVHDHELVALDRAAELRLQHQPLDRGSAHLRREEAVAVAAVLLRVVHGGVRVADQVHDVVRIPRAERDADAAGDVQLVLVQVEGAAELVEQLARERPDHGAVVRRGREILDKEGKFVAREASEHGVAGQFLVHALGEDLERPVARRVPEGVVDLLEMVEVEVDERELAARAARAGDRLLQRMLELQPVRDLGERVVAGEVADSPLGALALGDVARDEDAALETRILGGHHGAGERHRDRLPGLRAHRQLEHLVRRLLDVEGRAILVRDQEGEFAAQKLHLRPAEHLRRREIDALDEAVGRGHEDRVVHAVQHDVERAAGRRMVGKVDPEALERGAERAADPSRRQLDVGRPVAARYALDLVQQVGERGVDAALEAPGRDDGDRQYGTEPDERPVLIQESEHGAVAKPRVSAHHTALGRNATDRP